MSRASHLLTRSVSPGTTTWPRSDRPAFPGLSATPAGDLRASWAPQRQLPPSASRDVTGRNEQHDRLWRVADGRLQLEQALDPGCDRYPSEPGRELRELERSCRQQHALGGHDPVHDVPPDVSGSGSDLDARRQQLEDEQEPARPGMGTRDVWSHARHHAASPQFAVLQLQHGVVGRRFRCTGHVQPQQLPSRRSQRRLC